jgi:hypothetical protein
VAAAAAARDAKARAAADKRLASGGPLPAPPAALHNRLSRKSEKLRLTAEERHEGAAERRAAIAKARSPAAKGEIARQAAASKAREKRKWGILLSSKDKQCAADARRGEKAAAAAAAAAKREEKMASVSSRRSQAGTPPPAETSPLRCTGQATPGMRRLYSPRIHDPTIRHEEYFCEYDEVPVSEARPLPLVNHEDVPVCGLINLDINS